MTVPKPPVPLDNSCSVIYDNTLYSYSPDAFLALPLKTGTDWKKLDMGESVTGATCVATPTGLFVVGGEGGSADYTGLQKYTYSYSNWTTITPSDQLTKDRQWHGTTYMPADDVILIYGGNQNGVQTPSSETFTIGASEPYTVNSFDPATEPAAIQPILMQWSDADAVMVGGDASNTGVYWFNPYAGWRSSGASLAQPLTKDVSSMTAVLIDGDDGSKSLYTFDMSQSPNQVERLVLLDASGTPVVNSTTVTRRSLDDSPREAKRSLTLSDWPQYNSTLATSETRQNFAMAQGDNGMVVFSGGNTKYPICMFDANKNSWMDASSVLSEKQQHVLGVSSSTASSHHKTTSASSATAASKTAPHSTHPATTAHTAAATSTSAAAAAGSNGGSGVSSNAILGITLGSIGGFLAVLLLILLLLRRRKQRQNHAEVGHARRASGLPSDEKESKGFANGALPPPTSPGHFRGHYPQRSQDSYSSMAILMGRMGQQKTSLTRQPSNESYRSSVSSLHKQFKSTISKPMPHAAPQNRFEPRNEPSSASNGAPPRPRNRPADPQDGTRRSSGWNRYWSGGSALQVIGFGGSKRNTTVSDSSRYSESTANINPRQTQDSATVPPLNFEGRASMNRVNSGSPVVAQHAGNLPLKEGMTGKIERPNSRDSSGYSSGIPESVNELWDPATASKPWGADRAPSSAYAPSHHYQSSLTPSYAGSRELPSGVSKQPQLAMASTSSDMSWLNLGEKKSRK